ncbi:MAG: septum formation initiator family protein [Patescibacteria group bacterium]
MKTQENHKGIRSLMRRRSYLVVNLVLLSVVGWSFFGELMRNQSMDDEIVQLQLQTAEMEKRNQDLRLIAERNTGSAMIEREARLKLNLKKPGEEVVIVREATADQTTTVEKVRISDSTAPTASTRQDIQGQSNIAKWLNHFLHNI